jgi:hypothetical protein
METIGFSTAESNLSDIGLFVESINLPENDVKILDHQFKRHLKMHHINSTNSAKAIGEPTLHRFFPSSHAAPPVANEC